MKPDDEIDYNITNDDENLEETVVDEDTIEYKRPHETPKEKT
jgi:hypothetical protein